MIDDLREELWWSSVKRKNSRLIKLASISVFIPVAFSPTRATNYLIFCWSQFGWLVINVKNNLLNNFQCMIIITVEYQPRKTIPRVAVCTQSKDKNQAQIKSLFLYLLILSTPTWFFQLYCTCMLNVMQFREKQLWTSGSFNIRMNLLAPLVNQHPNVRR